MPKSTRNGQGSGADALTAPFSVTDSNGLSLVAISDLGEQIYKLHAGSPFRVIADADDPDNNFAIIDVDENSAIINLSAFNFTEFSVRAEGGFAKKLISAGFNDTSEIIICYAAGKLGFFGTPGITRPEVPANPTAQDVVDALVALGLITQAP